MAQLHALVDAPRGVVVDAAIFHVVLRLAQCFAADIPATVWIVLEDRCDFHFIMHFILMILILTSVECRVGSTPAPGPCGRSSGTAWRAASSAKASGSRGKPSCSLLTRSKEDSVI